MKEEMLKLRKAIKKKKPEFKRQECHRKKSLGNKWRKPRGIHSKLRRQEKAKGSLPGPGYGSPSGVRGLDREGFREVVVRNPKDLESLNPKEDVAVISKTVGRKNMFDILEEARKRNIKIGNYKII